MYTILYIYIRQGSYVFASLFVCLCVSNITQKVMEGSFRNFQGMSGMAKTTSDSILEVIRKESWFEIFVNIALNGTTVLCRINMLGGGLRSPSALKLPASLPQESS